MTWMGRAIKFDTTLETRQAPRARPSPRAPRLREWDAEKARPPAGREGGVPAPVESPPKPALVETLTGSGRALDNPVGAVETQLQLPRLVFTGAGPGSFSLSRRFMMIRSMRLTVGLLSLFLMTGRDARAQWGYGGWGWGGWGAATPQGACAHRGSGTVCNGCWYVQSQHWPQARSINADTAMRWNQYAYLSHLEASQRYAARKNAEIATNKAHYNEHQRRLREKPENREVENGDALNAAVSDLIESESGQCSAMRAGTAPVSASVIAEIPFLYASERITVMLDGIRESIKWPSVFEGERFAATQNQFDELRQTAARGVGTG